MVISTVRKRRRPSTPRQSRLRICLIAEGRYLTHLQPRGLAAELSARGHDIRLLDPEVEAFATDDERWLTGADVVICRGRSPAVLSLLRWAETRGIRTINRRESIASVLNKAEMSVALTAAGVPMPASFMGPLAKLAGTISESQYPVILKPVFGDNCRNLKVVNNAAELKTTPWPEPAALAQQFMRTNGYDLKLYGIGTEVQAVRKPSCMAERDGRPAVPYMVPVSREMRELALRCAELFKLELFGVDCIETSQGLMVVEVNDFPNYTSVPGAAGRLADFVLTRATGR